MKSPFCRAAFSCLITAPAKLLLSFDPVKVTVARIPQLIYWNAFFRPIPESPLTVCTVCFHVNLHIQLYTSDPVNNFRHGSNPVAK
jgi:hypothetical protein